MATTITAGNATNGAAISSDNTGILELKTGTGAGTTAMTVNSSQNVGIGTTTPNIAGVSRALTVNTTNASSGAIYELAANGTNYAYLFANASNTVLSSVQSLPLLFNTNNTERARIDASGNMMWNGTNTTTGNGNIGYVYKFFGAANNIIIPMESSGTNRYGVFEYRRTGRAQARTAQIAAGENASNQGEVLCYSSAANSDISGGVSLSNGATAWASASDIRLKTVTGTYTNALQDIAQIEPIKFIWKHDQSNTPQVGVSAQSVENIVPEAITRSKNIATPDDETEYLSVRYTELIPLMIASIKELKAELDATKAEMAALKGAAQ